MRNGVWRILFLGAGLGLLYQLQSARSNATMLALRMGFLLVLAGDILSHSPNQIPSLPSSVMAPGLWQQQQTAPPPSPGQSRIMITPQAEKALLRSSVEDHFKDFLGKRLALWSNLNLLDGIPKVNGSSTLQLREQKEVQDLLYKQTNVIAAGLVDFLAVSQRTAANSAVEWTNRSTQLPWISGGQQPLFANAPDTLRRLVEPNFDPRAVVYLPLEAESEAGSVVSTACHIQSQIYTSHETTFTVEAERPSMVVISQSFYHPWKARIDDYPAILWRANHAFQALIVPAGTHQVQLSYRDRNFRLGLIITGLTLAAVAFLILRRQRPPHQSGQPASLAG